MKVFYDNTNDVVSIYYEAEDEIAVTTEISSEDSNINFEYNVDEAANLILDMVDLKDNRGNSRGFRVYNASKYYSKELLNYADSELLSNDELKNISNEKTIYSINKVN